MERQYYVRLSGGSTAVEVGQQRGGQWRIWVGWQGEYTLHQRPDGTFSVVGHWHITIFNRLSSSRPDDRIVEDIRRWMNEQFNVYRDVLLRLAGPPFGRPRHEGSEYPRLYILNVQDRPHASLSTLRQRMEQATSLTHQFRDNFHLSIDEFPVEFEWVE